ncbi:MAG TPA: cation:proton antiporter [Lacunisphaera sp.]
MSFESWILIISGVLLGMGLTANYVSRLPFTPTMIYLTIGILLGPAGWEVLRLDPVVRVDLFHHCAEVAVVISLFTVGLKLRMPLRDARWRPPLVLAFVSMAVTVGLIAVVSAWAFDLPWGAAILLGAILAPTDPVLASDVQMKHPGDRDELRTALSGEAGFNDGTSFPFVMLGLGLLGLHDLGPGAWHWWAVDVVWAIVGGLGIGGALGWGAGRLILQMRSRKRESVTLDEYLLLGLIGLAYALAVKLETYGFLAVFAAGVAVRAVERWHTKADAKLVDKVLAEGPKAIEPGNNSQLEPAYMAGALLSFNEQLEHILEVGLVLMVGAALFVVGLAPAALWFAPLLFCVIRPLAVLPVWLTGRLTRAQFAGVAWFGIRGIGSIYYLMYALTLGLPSALARPMASLTFTIVAISIVLHGVSVTPLLGYLERRDGRGPT